VSTAVALGFNGLEAEVGYHVCGMYSGREQRDQILIPFLEAGLASGDKCLCVVDGTDPVEILDMLGVDLHARTRNDGKQLEVMRATDMYLRSGGFSADEIIASWKAAISDVMYDGSFDVVRAVETWSRRDVVPDSGELLRLESEMNRYLPLYPQVILCLYDLDRFGGGIVVDLLRTHPLVLVGGMLVKNPYFATPDQLLTEAELPNGPAVKTEIEKAAAWYSDVTSGSI
jgi:hypothetical protein